jgi:UTP:GlnB (protein PII) uridylyltransferase
MSVAIAGEIRHLLGSTTVPVDDVDRLLEGASPLWLASAPAAVLAGDLALTHPALAGTEVRAVARDVVGGGQRLAVVARDRPGLLADTAAAITGAGFAITSASAVTWPAVQLALHALTISTEDDAWDELGQRLRAVGQGARPAIAFCALGPATVAASARMATNGQPGRSIVTVDAPDAPGLFATACACLADGGITIDAVHAETIDGWAHDVFVTSAVPDVGAVERDLGEALRPRPAP